MAIKLTESAAKEVQRVKDSGKIDANDFLRIGVKSGGCSGFEYFIKFDGGFDAAKDHKYDYHGVEVVVDKRSALYLDQTTVDWFESFEKRGFKFDNPAAARTCGCGSSFQA